MSSRVPLFALTVRIVSQWRPEFLHPLLHIFNRTAEEDPSYLLWDIPLFAVTLVHASKYSEDEASPIFSLALLPFLRDSQ